jgi:hypothetical protein
VKFCLTALHTTKNISVRLEIFLLSTVHENVYIFESLMRAATEMFGQASLIHVSSLTAYI